MNINELCLHLETEFGFDGDLQASDDVVKDAAVRLYLKSMACLDEYFPEQIESHQKLIDLLYTDHNAFFFEWANQAQHAGVSGELFKSLCFESQYLDGTCFKYFIENNPAEFAASIGDSFYLQAETYLQDALYYAHQESQAIKSIEFDEWEADMKRASGE